MKIEITFRDEQEDDSIELCIEHFMQYLRECVKYGDVSAFNFNQID